MSFLDLIFPKKCLECNTNGKYICDSCLEKMQKGRLDFKNNIFSIWNYEGVVRKAIIKLKYNFATDIVEELSAATSEKIKLPIKLTNLVLVPIPLHKRRKNWRGFNQAEVLGKLISKQKKWNFEQNLLTRHLASKPQVKLYKKERLRNISGKFEVNKSAAHRLQSTDSSIIIFDDVVTTGATLKEAIKVLKNAGFKKVIGLTLCSN